jgi:phosphotransferase system  glucose/maltose/N-acetylglucosamine-specific IIC component
MIWGTAHCFKGQGTLPQTRGAVIWTLLCSIPIGFFLLLIYFTFRRQDLGSLSLLIRIASYAGVLTTLIYGFIVLLKAVSATHHFGLWRAFFFDCFGTYCPFSNFICWTVFLFLDRCGESAH